MANKTLQKIIAVLFALLVWQIVSMLVGYEVLLASPLKVIQTLLRTVATAAFWSTVCFSVLRIILGFIAAFVLGLFLGILSGRFHWVKTLLWPFVVCIKSIPVASFIVLSLIWLSSSQLVSFVCFLACLPVIYNNVTEGLANVEPGQKEAALMLGASWPKIVRTVYIPNIEPYLLSAASTGCGMAFKAGVAAEVVAIVAGSIGEQIYMSKIYFETASLFTWTLVIVLLSYLFEKLFTFILQKLIKALI